MAEDKNPKKSNHKLNPNAKAFLGTPSTSSEFNSFRQNNYPLTYPPDLRYEDSYTVAQHWNYNPHVGPYLNLYSYMVRNFPPICYSNRLDTYSFELDSHQGQRSRFQNQNVRSRRARSDTRYNNPSAIQATFTPRPGFEPEVSTKIEDNIDVKARISDDQQGRTPEDHKQRTLYDQNERASENHKPRTLEDQKGRISEDYKPRTLKDQERRISEEQKPRIWGDQKPIIPDNPKPIIPENPKPIIPKDPKPIIPDDPKPKFSERPNKQLRENETPKSVPIVESKHNNSALDEFLLPEPVAAIAPSYGENDCVCGNSCESLAKMRSSFSEWFDLVNYDCCSFLSKSLLKSFPMPFCLCKVYVIIRMYYNCFHIAAEKPELSLNVTILNTETNNVVKVYKKIGLSLIKTIRTNDNIQSIISIGLLYVKGSVTCTFIQWLKEQLDGLEDEFQIALNKLPEDINYTFIIELKEALSKWLIYVDLYSLFPECFPKTSIKAQYNTDSSDDEYLEEVFNQTLKRSEKAAHKGSSKQNKALEELDPKRSITSSLETLNLFRIETGDAKGTKNLYHVGHRDDFLKGTALSIKDTLEEDGFDFDINDIQRGDDTWISTLGTSVRKEIFETSNILDSQDTPKLASPNKSLFVTLESKSPIATAELFVPISTVDFWSQDISSYTDPSNNQTIAETKFMKIKNQSKKQKMKNITKEIQTTFMEQTDRKESYCDVLKHTTKSVMKQDSKPLIISEPVFGTHSDITWNVHHTQSVKDENLKKPDSKNDLIFMAPVDQSKRKKKTKAQKKADLKAALQEEEHIKSLIEFVKVKEENILTEKFPTQLEEDPEVEKYNEEISKKASFEKKNVMKQMLSTVNVNKNSSRTTVKKDQTEDKMNFEDNPLYKKALLQYVTKNELVSELEVKDIENYSLSKRKKYSSSSSIMNQQVRKRIKEFQKLWMEKQGDLAEKDETDEVPPAEKTPEKPTKKEKKRTKYIERQTVKSKPKRAKDEKKTEEAEQEAGEMKNKEKSKKKKHDLTSKRKIDEAECNTGDRRKIKKEYLESPLEVKPEINPTLSGKLVVTEKVELASLSKEIRKEPSGISSIEIKKELNKSTLEITVQESQTQVEKILSNSVRKELLEKKESGFCGEQCNGELKSKEIKYVNTTKHHSTPKSCQRDEMNSKIVEIKPTEKHGVELAIPDKRTKAIDAQRQREIDAPTAVLKKRASRQHHKDRAEFERIAEEVVTVLRIRIYDSFAYIKQVKATPEQGAQLAYKYMCGNGYGQEIDKLLRAGTSAAAIRLLLSHPYNLFHSSIRKNTRFMLLDGRIYEEEDLQFADDQLQSVDEEISILEKINTAISWVITSCESAPQYVRDFGTWKQFSQRLKGNGNVKDENVRKCSKRLPSIPSDTGYDLIEKFITDVYIQDPSTETYDSLQSILQSHKNIARLWNIPEPKRKQTINEHDFDYLHFFLFHVHEMFMNYWIAACKKYSYDNNTYNEVYIEKLHILYNKIIQAEKQMKLGDDSLGLMWFWNYYIRALIGNNHCESKINREQMNDLRNLYNSSKILRGLPPSKFSKLNWNQKQIALRSTSLNQPSVSTAMGCTSNENINCTLIKSHMLHQRVYPKFKKVAKIMTPILQEVYKVVPDKDYLQIEHTEVSIDECSQQVNDVSDESGLNKPITQENFPNNIHAELTSSRPLPEEESSALNNPGDVKDTSPNEQEPQPFFINDEVKTEDTEVCKVALEMEELANDEERLQIETTLPDHKNECIPFNIQDQNTSHTHLPNVNDNNDNPQIIKKQPQIHLSKDDDPLKISPIVDIEKPTSENIEQNPTVDINRPTSDNIKQNSIVDSDKSTPDNIEHNPTLNNDKPTSDKIKDSPPLDMDSSTRDNIKTSPKLGIDSSTPDNNKSTGTLKEAIKSCISSFLYRPLKSFTKPKKETSTNIEQGNSDSQRCETFVHPQMSVDNETSIVSKPEIIISDKFLKYFFPNHYNKKDFYVSDSIRKTIKEFLEKLYDECMRLQKILLAKESKLLYTIVKNDVIYVSSLKIGLTGVPFIDQTAELLNKFPVTANIVLDSAAVKSTEINAAPFVNSFRSPNKYSSGTPHTQDPWWDPPETYGNRRASMSEGVFKPFVKTIMQSNVSKTPSPKKLDTENVPLEISTWENISTDNNTSKPEGKSSSEISKHSLETILAVENQAFVAGNYTTNSTAQTNMLRTTVENNTLETSLLQNSLLEYSSELSDCLAHTSGTSQSTSENTSSEWETPVESPSQVITYCTQAQLDYSNYREYFSAVNQTADWNNSNCFPIQEEQYFDSPSSECIANDAPTNVASNLGADNTEELEKHLLVLDLVKSLKIIETTVFKIRTDEDVADTGELTHIFNVMGATFQNYLGNNVASYEYFQFLFGGITNFVKNFYADWIFQKYMNNIQTKNIQHWDDDQLSTEGNSTYEKAQSPAKQIIKNEKKQQREENELKKKRKRRKTKVVKEIKFDNRDPSEEKRERQEGSEDKLNYNSEQCLDQVVDSQKSNEESYDTEFKTEATELIKEEDAIQNDAGTQVDSNVDASTNETEVSVDIMVKKRMTLQDEWHRIFFYRPYILRQALKLLMAIRRSITDSRKEPSETPGTSNDDSTQKEKADSSRLVISKMKISRASLRRRIGKDLCNKRKRELEKSEENISVPENEKEDKILKLVKDIELEKLRDIPKFPVENSDLLFSNECSTEAESSMYSLIRKFRRRYFRSETIEGSSKFTSQYLAMIKTYQNLEKKRFLQAYELKTASNQMEPNEIERKGSIIPLHEVTKTDFGTHVVYHRIGYEIENTGIKSVANLFMYDYIERPEYQGFIVKGHQVKYVFNSDKFPKKFQLELQKSYKMQKVVEHINKQLSLNVDDPSFWGKITENKSAETLMQFDEYLDNTFMEEVMDSHAYFY